MDGLFQELVIEPIKISEARNDKETTVIGKDGREIPIEKRGARSSLYLYLLGNKMSRPEIWAMKPSERAKALTAVLLEKPRTFKLILTSDDKVDAVVTDQHKQIAYSEVAKAVQDVIQDVVPNAEFFDRGLDRYFTYSLPIESKYVKSYVGIDAGINKPHGRCAVYVYTRMEVNWTGQDGTRVPCHNWAFWGRPSKFFNIDLNNIGIPPIEKLGSLSSKAVHVQGTKIDSEELTGAIKKILESADVIDPIIEDAMRVPITFDDVKAILEAYKDTVGLPDYAVEEIQNHIIDYDVWGLSNAVSWFRTHGELKKSKTENREARPIIFTLENIAGELLTLGPAIRELKSRLPDAKITKEALLNPTEALFSKKVAEQVATAVKKAGRPRKEKTIKTGEEIFKEE